MRKYIIAYYFKRMYRVRNELKNYTSDLILKVMVKFQIVIKKGIKMYISIKQFYDCKI